MRGKRGISDKMRRDAILICELAGHCAEAIGDSVEDAGASKGASSLAIDARWAARDCAWPSLGYADSCLEAAALLRDGWSPGDPVVRRGGGSWKPGALTVEWSGSYRVEFDAELIEGALDADATDEAIHAAIRSDAINIAEEQSCADSGVRGISDAHIAAVRAVLKERAP